MRTDFILEHQCPQCGAGVNLSDTDRIFSCPYCKANLVVVGQPHYAYYLKPSPKAPKDLIFVPYWRFKGTHWTLNRGGVHHNLTDQSVCAASFPCVPQTLGIRSQCVTMKFVQPHSEGVFLDADVDCENARTRLFPSMSERARRASILLNTEGAGDCGEVGLPAMTAFSGEAISLVYAPHFVRDGILHDGVSLSALGSVSVDLPEWIDARPMPPIFISALCPVCGWDCSAEHDSLVLLCTKCDKAWIGRNSGLEGMEILISPGHEQGDIHIPFWRFEVRHREFPLATYADLVRLTNLPKVILPDMESQKLFFWIPAFKSNPEIFHRLAKLMTISQKPQEYVTSIPASNYYPVTLPAEEGFKTISILLGDIGLSRKTLLSRLEESSFDSMPGTLVYVPFSSTGGELIAKHLNFAIQSSTLKWGRLL
jgi:hypothetical protein